MINTSDFEQYLVVKKHLEPNSIRLVLSRFRIFNNFLIIGCYTLNKASVETFLFSLKLRKLKNSSINSYIFCLKFLYDYLLDRSIPCDNFMEGIESLDKQRPVITILTVEEVEKLLSTDLEYGRFRGVDASPLNHIYKVFTRFLYSTGCRFEDAARLTVQYLDLASGRVVFVDTKNHENREVYITQPLTSLLRDFTTSKKGTDLVFQSFIGSPMIPQNFNGDLKRRAIKAGITKRVHPHLLRHSYGTHLYIATHDIGLVQMVLGHKDIKSTMIYIHLAGELIRNGMMMAPIARFNVDPLFLLKNADRDLEKYDFEHHPRFNRMKAMEARHAYLEMMNSAIM